MFILRSENVPINGPMLQDKALEFTEGLNVDCFQTSNGWLEKWKEVNSKCLYISK